MSDSKSNTKTIDDLRARLFAAIDGVKDGSITVDQARTIGELSQVVVNSAKVEVDYLKVTEVVLPPRSKFMQSDTDEKPAALPNGITGITRHRLVG
jgi:hypothetical protein